MLIPTIVMGILAVILFAISYSKGKHVEGLKITFSMMIEMLPLLFFALIIAGMVRTLLPHELLSKWIGAESGIRGIFIGSLAGAFAPGGPYTNFPIAAALLRSGATMGTMVAFLTAWSLWALARLPLEVGILGWRFTIIRLVSVLFFPPMAGLIAQAVAKAIKF